MTLSRICDTGMLVLYILQPALFDTEGGEKCSDAPTLIESRRVIASPETCTCNETVVIKERRN